MRRFRFLLLFLPVVFTVCGSTGTVRNSSAKESLIPTDETQTSDSMNISQEMYEQTLAEVRLFVDKLNLLIQNKNYAGWKDALSNERFEQISSPEFLESASESAALKSRKITLKTADDYFEHVVVPSRSNSRVDEIEFTARNRVKVYYVEKPRRNDDNTAEIRRLRLYELEKTGDIWKIID
jgi:hypothetical protein